MLFEVRPVFELDELAPSLRPAFFLEHPSRNPTKQAVASSPSKVFLPSTETSETEPMVS